ncbi:MAG: class I SAM-dependent methyltransferase [Bacteroidota bacterium]
MTTRDDEYKRLRDIYAEYGSDGHKQKSWLFNNPGNKCIVDERESRIRSLLSSHESLCDGPVLDIGCGAGDLLRVLIDLGIKPKSIIGADLLPERLRQASERYPECSILQANGLALPFQNESISLLCQFTLLSSVLDPEIRLNMARESLRVMRNNGLLLLYDIRYNNPANPHVRRIGRNEMKRLFPGCVIVFRSLTLLPPLARKLGRATNILYPLLCSIPLFRTHYLCTIQKS